MRFSNAKNHFRRAQQTQQGDEAAGVTELAKGLQELTDAIERQLADIYSDIKRIKGRQN